MHAFHTERTPRVSVCLTRGGNRDGRIMTMLLHRYRLHVLPLLFELHGTHPVYTTNDVCNIGPRAITRGRRRVLLLTCELLLYLCYVCLSMRARTITLAK
jgi:hypothetical protein